MCEHCEKGTIPQLDREAAIEEFEEHIDALAELHAQRGQLSEKDRQFADSLYFDFVTHGGLSGKQWQWVHTLLFRIQGAQHLEGSFKPIFVMFRIANSNGELQRPKVRLLSPDGIFVQLNFNPDRPEEISIFRDGWQGHGRRRYAGKIVGDSIQPWSADRMTPGMVAVIQQLASDPIGTAKAMAHLLGCCLYCGQRLSDEESKARGYGATCAKNWQQPWGDRTNAPLSERDQSILDEFDSLFTS